MAIPNELATTFKPREIYLIAGMYSTCRYKTITQEYYKTDVTIEQLVNITGDNKYYIRESFFESIRKHNNNLVKWDGNFYWYSKTSGDAVKRNMFSLKNCGINFRIIHSGIFQDERFTPAEKGYIIALYILCVNNTFRFDLSDKVIASKLGVSINTWKKYKKALMAKGVIQEFKDAPAHLLDIEFENALVLNYPYLGCMGSKDHTVTDEVEMTNFEDIRERQQELKNEQL